MGRDNEPNLERFGSLIARRRKELRMTQDELAQRVGWSQERISTIERGRYGLPSLPSLARLATALSISLIDVLEAAGFQDARAAADESAQSNPAVLLYALERLLEVEGTDAHEMFDETCTILGEALQADKVDVFLPDDASDTLVAIGTSKTAMGQRQRELGLDRLPLAGGGTEVSVFQTGQPFETGRAAEDPNVLPGFKNELGVHSMIQIPIVREGAVHGVLVISSGTAERFTDEDRRFTEAASRWIALMLHRAELSAQLEQLQR